MPVRVDRAKLTYLMNEQGFKTQVSLAKAIDRSPISLNRIIKGRQPTIGGKTIERLCDTLKCQPGDFLVNLTEGESDAD